LETQNQPASGPDRFTVEQRRQPRFKIEVDIVIHSKTCHRLKGRTVDISESGISAILKIGVPLGELVELEFTLPFGPVTIYALVRQQNAFRYGFQFAESNAVNAAILATCHHLAMERSLLGEIAVG
jgi:hypothetical protein